LPEARQPNEKLCHSARHHSQRATQIILEKGKIPLNSACPANEDMIGTGHAVIGQDRSGHCAETALHPISDDRISDLFRDSKADPHLGISIGAIADKQKQATGGSPFSAICGQKI
jgi:hypothetical protein